MVGVFEGDAGAAGEDVVDPQRPFVVHRPPHLRPQIRQPLHHRGGQVAVERHPGHRLGFAAEPTHQVTGGGRLHPQGLQPLGEGGEGGAGDRPLEGKVGGG